MPDTNVTFTVDNIAGGNSTVGTVSNTGVYTAPNAAGKHTVRVTDATLNYASGAVVTVFSTITADFGSRANNTSVIPANIFAYSRGEAVHNAVDRALLTQAGVTVSRMSANIVGVFATSTADWTHDCGCAGRRPARAAATQPVASLASADDGGLRGQHVSGSN